MPTEIEIQNAITEGRAIFDADGKVATIYLGQDDDGMACYQPITWSPS